MSRGRGVVAASSNGASSNGGRRANRTLACFMDEKFFFDKINQRMQMRFRKLYIYSKKKKHFVCRFFINGAERRWKAQAIARLAELKFRWRRRTKCDDDDERRVT